jgi:hypothetical protein
MNAPQNQAMNGRQQGLFDAQRPASVTVSGDAMLDKLRDLKARGAHVSGMASAKPSGWRLIVEWPDTPEARCQSNGALHG